MSEEQLQEHLLKERLRIKNYRSKKSMKPTSSLGQGTAYRSRHLLDWKKLRKRLQTGLPSSPRKKQFAVQTFAKSVGI